MMRVISLPGVAVLGTTREMSFWILLFWFFGCLFFSTGGATGGGFLLFFIGVKMADLGIVTFLECFEGRGLRCRTFW